MGCIPVHVCLLWDFSLKNNNNNNKRHVILNCISSVDIGQEKDFIWNAFRSTCACSGPLYGDSWGPGESCVKFRWPQKKKAGITESKECSRSEMKCQQLSIESPFHFLILLPFVLKWKCYPRNEDLGHGLHTHTHTHTPRK